MDIDDLVNFINEDKGESKKKKGKKKKKQEEPIEEKKEEDKKEDTKSEEIKQTDNNEEGKSKKKKKKKKTTEEAENTITTSDEPKENPYRSLIKYDESIKIDNTRFQDNSILRVLNNWEEAKDPSTWKQTNYPTKSMDEQYSKPEELPIGKILEYEGEKGIFRSTSEKMKEKEKDLTEIIYNYRKAAEAHRQIRKYAQTILRPGIKLIDFCQKLETMLRRFSHRSLQVWLLKCGKQARTLLAQLKRAHNKEHKVLTLILLEKL